jgi:hypothetical protein
MTSQRIALLAMLTACMYAFSIYMQHDIWLFPFGLFRVGLFVVFILMLVAEKKAPTLPDFLVLAWTALFAISSNFILQFFFGEKSFLEHHSEIELFTSWTLLGFAVILLFWQVRMAWSSEGWKRWMQLVGGLSFFYCMITNDFRWVLFPVLLWFIALRWNETAPDTHRSIASVFLFIIASTYVSGFFFGMEHVLGYL